MAGLFRERAEDVDAIFRAERDEARDVGRCGWGQRQLLCRLARLGHHADEAVAGHGEDQHGGWCRAGAAEAVRPFARKKDVAARPEHDPLAVADEGELAIENVERLVFVVVEVIRRGIAGRGGLVDEGERSAGGRAGGLDDVEAAVEPPGSAFGFGKTHEDRLSDHWNLSGRKGLGMRSHSTRFWAGCANGVARLECRGGKAVWAQFEGEVQKPPRPAG